MAQLFYTVKPLADETFKVGDLVHRLKTDQVFRILDVKDEMVQLVSNVPGPGNRDFWLGRELFDEQVVYGGEATRVYGRVKV